LSIGKKAVSDERGLKPKVKSIYTVKPALAGNKKRPSG
jgi:hypothetical protein